MNTQHGSPGRTWFVDIDGTVFLHAGYRGAPDIPVSGVRAFLAGLPPQDVVVLTTARLPEQQPETEEALRREGIRWDRILYGLPPGPRILVNDRLPGDAQTAFALNVERNRPWSDLARKIGAEG